MNIIPSLSQFVSVPREKLSPQEFSSHKREKRNSPVIIKGQFGEERWPCLRNWQDPDYFKVRGFEKEFICVDVKNPLRENSVSQEGMTFASFIKKCIYDEKKENSKALR